MIKKYSLLLFLLPSIYVGSYAYICLKKGEKKAAAGAFIATAAPLILAVIMFLSE
ncbi:hypothetical protein [Lutispora saccharofermentans]|uniref:Uncharacterized protein n=1 Tax=Lutispora saccharofermentans TaxID=3024236 RepID=A0ABT1NIK0_9FIRM|nr:hypothetical protein [Lutispora saccharofermentans]MCQ1530889.1 hypothetical protein [Lutispora saccharofermentans]